MESTHCADYVALTLATQRLFAEVEARPWGYLVHNAANREHHSANTALWRVAGAAPEAVIDEIVAFYRARGITPRVQGALADLPPDLDERLAARGFVCDRSRLQLMRWAWQPVEAPAPPTGVALRWATPADAGALGTILTESNGWAGRAWAVHYLGAMLRSAQARFALALVGDVPAAMAGVVQGEGLGLVVDVATHPDWRRRGLAHAVVAQLQASATTPLLLDVTAANAQRLYARAGFQVVGVVEALHGWQPAPP